MKLVSNSAIYFAGSIASRMLSLISLPFLTRALTPEEYGVIAMLTMLGVFLCALLSMGLGTSIGEAYFREQDKHHRVGVVTSGLMIISFSHILFVFMVWPLAVPISQLLFHTDAFSYITALMLIGQIVQNLVFPLQLKIQFEERAKIASLAMILSAFVSVGLALLFVVVEQRGLEGYAEAMVVAAIIQVFIYFTLSRVEFASISVSLVRELIHKGWPMILSFLLLFVVQYGIRLPIEWFGGLKAVGIFQIGASLAAPMGMVTVAFVNAWTPYALAYADKREEASHALAKATHLYVIFVGAAVVLIFTISPWMAQLLAAKEYYESYYIIGLCALWHYYSSIFLLLLPPVYFANEVASTVVRVQAFTVALFVCICVPLTMFAPLTGAGIAMALAGFILVVAQLYWNKRKMASRYVQINYAKSTYALIILIGLGGVLVLAMEVFLGRSVAAVVGFSILILLLKIGFSAANIGLEWRRIRSSLYKRGM